MEKRKKKHRIVNHVLWLHPAVCSCSARSTGIIHYGATGMESTRENAIGTEKEKKTNMDVQRALFKSTDPRVTLYGSLVKCFIIERFE